MTIACIVIFGLFLLAYPYLRRRYLELSTSGGIKTFLLMCDLEYKFRVSCIFVPCASIIATLATFVWHVSGRYGLAWAMVAGWCAFGSIALLAGIAYFWHQHRIITPPPVGKIVLAIPLHIMSGPIMFLFWAPYWQLLYSHGFTAEYLPQSPFTLRPHKPREKSMSVA